MISVSIPNVRQIVHDDEKYTAYQVVVQVSGKTHVIEKRYREFHSLHKQVKKSIETPDFPPKKMRSLSMKGIEQRRQALETYLQELLAKNNVPKSLLTFLKVKNFKTVSYESHHQPVMSCQSDAYLYPPSCNSSLPDSLDKGVRLGLYEDTVEVT
ncbi:sorting nexin-24-like isoform X2 [Acanthaster planci]|uniref:Sorting nexin-24-like isoform X2 n=1 Tax=Acanthaster planci TaxID=133434 RepID=A0A8B8A6A6_ACAPL|nr:sorting nexin-24-like isoform X2 [Acanthaster planci]